MSYPTIPCSITDKTFENFAKKVVYLGECWLWVGAVNGRSPTKMNYGQFRDANGRRCPAHRFAYELFIGPIPHGLDVDHLCRQSLCVNPWHLEPVTRQENLLRGLHIVPCQHGLRARDHCDQCTRDYHREHSAVWYRKNTRPLDSIPRWE